MTYVAHYGVNQYCAVVEIIDLVKVKVLTFKEYFIKRNGGLSKKMVAYFCYMNFFFINGLIERNQ